MKRQIIFIMFLVITISACTNKDKNEKLSSTPPSKLLVQADILHVQAKNVTSGPIVSGSLKAKKQADMRAEVPVIVMKIFKDNGDQVASGEILIKLDDTTFRQSLKSSQEAERLARLSFIQADRQYNRLKTLSNTGAVSRQVLEDSELRRDAAKSELAASHAQVAEDLQQLERTEIRAPFAGVISNRVVSNGDTVQIGKALLHVVDPQSIYFEGFVSTENITKVKVGQNVNFRIGGYHDKSFVGVIERINPVVDPVSRQLAVEVKIVDSHTLTVGLFAEGNVHTNTLESLTVPQSCLVQVGDKNYVWRIHNGTINKVEIKIGSRDLITGNYTVLDGLKNGDQIIRHPRGNLTDGVAVEVEPNLAAL